MNYKHLQYSGPWISLVLHAYWMLVIMVKTLKVADCHHSFGGGGTKSVGGGVKRQGDFLARSTMDIGNHY